MLTEFKKFALRGNLMEPAVALILGLAFSAVVSALVAGVTGEPPSTNRGRATGRRS